MKTLPTLVASVAVLALSLMGCTTISTEFDEGVSPEIYFQRAQTAVDRNEFDTAMVIYRKFLDTGISDPYYVISAKYEIAFLHYKKGETQQAIDAFEELLRTYYADSVLQDQVPAWPRVLSQRLLKKLKGES